MPVAFGDMAHRPVGLLEMRIETEAFLRSYCTAFLHLFLVSLVHPKTILFDGAIAAWLLPRWLQLGGLHLYRRCSGLQLGGLHLN